MDDANVLYVNGLLIASTTLLAAAPVLAEFLLKRGLHPDIKSNTKLFLSLSLMGSFFMGLGNIGNILYLLYSPSSIKTFSIGSVMGFGFQLLLFTVGAIGSWFALMIAVTKESSKKRLHREQPFTEVKR
jgi:mannose/fructose/N-acetylgalactosamine-specific phosphotransferase system component IIC